MILFNSGTQGWGWLSNFSAHPIVDKQGLVWPTVEHAYQAMKSLDAGERERLRCLVDAAAVKKAARGISVREGWNDMKETVMLRLLRAKFHQHNEVYNRLLATGDVELVHDCPWGDTYWGVCKGKGQNVLGKLLMQVRAELR